MPKKILVIDDAPSVQQFTEALTEKGYLVFSISLGKDIQKVMHQEKPDLVVVDAFYNHASILSTLNHLIEHNIPFLLFSDDEHIDDLIKPHLLGALSFLVKPISDKQIKFAVETTLYWHTERLQLERRTDNLNITVENNRKISVALGILMERYQLDNAKSFELLRKTARDNQCRILDVALKISEDFEKSLLSFPFTGCTASTEQEQTKALLLRLNALLAD
ncbi:MAG: ANTAR domain-containing protein [Methylococcaceae bacterium]|nr:ANTAR domain-containing protein [Methylococcaceae bacterium]